jgi:quinol monooxygenase YgiN
MRCRIGPGLTAMMVASVMATPDAQAEAGPGGFYANIPDGAFSVVAEIRAKPGKEAELRAVTLPLIGFVRGDQKNFVYFLQEDRQTPGHFTFYEVFASKADFEAHNAKPDVKAWFAQLPDLAEGTVSATKMQILAALMPRKPLYRWCTGTRRLNAA